MNTDATQEFTINLAVAAPCWAPEIWQIQQFLNPHYLNSLWIGTVWNTVLLPSRIIHEIIKPVFRGEFAVALTMVVGIPYTFIRNILVGAAGKLRGVGLPLNVILNAEFLDEDEAFAQMQKGNYDLVRKNPMFGGVPV